MTRTIIIPLSDPREDEEGIAEQAINCTRMLAGSGDERVLLVSAIEDESVRPERQAYLHHIAASIGHDVETRVELGDPAAAILKVSTQVIDPIIVMASHGRSGVRLRVLGSITAAVAHEAHCPVMILPASPATQAPMCNRIERVLLPINDPAIAEALVDAAVAELDADRARTIEFHLVEVTVPVPPQPAVTDGERYADSHEVPAHFLRRIAETLQARGYRATWDLRIGNPSQEITRIAGERQIDLIVMPAWGRHGFNSLVPKLFASQIRTHETVPVLLVRVQLAGA